MARGNAALVIVMSPYTLLGNDNNWAQGGKSATVGRRQEHRYNESVLSDTIFLDSSGLGVVNQ